MKENLDEYFIKEIIERLKKRLDRNLTVEELNTFKIQRSLMAYEMILDYISDKKLSKKEIENYVQEVVSETYT